MLDLRELDRLLNEAMANDTAESLNKWLLELRSANIEDIILGNMGRSQMYTDPKMLQNPQMPEAKYAKDSTYTSCGGSINYQFAA